MDLAIQVSLSFFSKVSYGHNLLSQLMGIFLGVTGRCKGSVCMGRTSGEGNKGRKEEWKKEKMEEGWKGRREEWKRGRRTKRKKCRREEGKKGRIKERKKGRGEEGKNGKREEEGKKGRSAEGKKEK